MRSRMPLIALLAVLWALTPAVTAIDTFGTVSGAVNVGTAKKYPTVVFIDEMPGQKFAAPAAKTSMDQKGKVFLPRVLPILVGTTVEFLNNDPFIHNVFSPDGETYDLGNWDQGQKRSYTFKNPGVYTQLCKPHPEMIAYVVVLKTPFFTIAGDTGAFTLAKVPVGTWNIKVWNERLKPAQLQKSFAVTVAAGQQVKIDITP